MGTVHLDPVLLERFAHRGWVVLPGFLNDAEIAQVHTYTQELCALPEISGAHMAYRETSLLDPQVKVMQRIEDFCPHHAGFDALLRGGRLQCAVEQLLGESAVLFKEKINFKMPGGAGFEAHQDQQAGWSRYAPMFVTALLSIDAATIENGCLEIVDMPRQSALMGSEWMPLSEQEMAASKLAALPTLPGDVVFFDSYVPHASKPNLTANPRRVLYVTYNRAADGDHRARYYADKRASFPPDIDRRPGVNYRFRV